MHRIRYRLSGGVLTRPAKAESKRRDTIVYAHVASSRIDIENIPTLPVALKCCKKCPVSSLGAQRDAQKYLAAITASLQAAVSDQEEKVAPAGAT
jgi:hypothetical protein